jgi:hypothetical protein
MKLLFDQNLSWRLPKKLADLYPDSQHVREVGMKESALKSCLFYSELRVAGFCPRQLNRWAAFF